MILDLVIEPVDGNFDIASIKTALLAMLHVAEVPHRPGTFILASHVDALEHALENGAGFSVALVSVSARSIDVGYRSGGTRSPRAFVAWLIAHQDVQIFDEDHNRIAADLDVIFGPPEFALAEFPRGATLDRGRYELTELVRGCADRGQYRARNNQYSGTVLVTLGPPQRDAYDVVRRRLEFDVPKIAPLLYVGPLEVEGEKRYDGLVEEEYGAPLVTPPARPIETILAIAEIVRAAHVEGIALGGLRPELVYLSGNDVSYIAPRCEPFLATATRRDYGVPPCFEHFYMSPEQLALQPATRSDDVFALAAMLAKWDTGEHPFEGEFGANAIAIVTGNRRAWRGDPALEPIVAAGLAKRLSLDELCHSLITRSAHSTRPT